jgi:flavodoxin
MRTNLFYFTGTGNSLKLAKELATELSGAKVISIAKAIKEEIDTSPECIGLVFPVYAFNAPVIVKDFINKLGDVRDRYIFAVANCAKIAGDVLGEVETGLKKKGAKLSAGFIVKMPGNYTALYGAIPDEKQEKVFTEARKKIKQIAEIVKNKNKGPLSRPKLLLRGASFLVRHFFSREKMHREDKKCVKVCPVDNVGLSKEKRPVWHHRCQTVFCLSPVVPSRSYRVWKVYHWPEKISPS